MVRVTRRWSGFLRMAFHGESDVPDSTRSDECSRRLVTLWEVVVRTACMLCQSVSSEALPVL
eukprot:scaffold7029_cov375-Pinguiococcus_pyrenoidosus.AAC.25